MANFKQNKGQDWPKVEPDHLNENDPLIVKVPMECADFGARPSTMGKAKNPESGGSTRMGIKHADSKK